MGQGHARSGGAHHPHGTELASLFSKRWREEAKDAEHISTAAAAEVVRRIAADLHLALTKEETHAWTASLGSGSAPVLTLLRGLHLPARCDFPA